MTTQAWLDELWNFDDAAASEASFRDAVAVLQTQLARALGLQDKFEEADAVLDTIEGAPDRVLLERGRLRNSAGDPAAAIPLFEAAKEQAQSLFIRVDALHMLAIADPERAAQHTAAALALLGGAEDDRTRRWAVGLHNNLGWRHFDAGEFTKALGEFELALEAAELYGTQSQRQYADGSDRRGEEGPRRLAELRVESAAHRAGTAWVEACGFQRR